VIIDLSLVGLSLGAAVYSMSALLASPIIRIIFITGNGKTIDAKLFVISFPGAQLCD
jgi:hypothetical protein